MRMMDGMKRKFRHAVEREEALLDLQTDYTKTHERSGGRFYGSRVPRPTQS
jgi:hypothetical protein